MDKILENKMCPSRPSQESKIRETLEEGGINDGDSVGIDNMSISEAAR